MASVKVENTERLLKRLDNIAKTDVYDTMIKATNMVHGQAKEYAPVRYGDLAGSIHQEVKKESNVVTGRVFTNKEYAPYVEFGTGIKGTNTYPYEIKGLNLTYRSTPWVYYDEKKDTFVYTTGQVAHSYMYRALKTHEKYIKSLFKTEVKAKIDSQCKGG